LEENLNGVTPCNYFTKFKKILKHATREGLFNRNPAEGISIRSHQSIQKDILNFEEIELLCQTRITNEQVKKAFLFSCYTGLRWCDVNALKWKDIDLKNCMISMLQQKTGIRVNVNLHESLTPILGSCGDPESRVFTLPSYTSCRKDLKYWVKKAGINKNITWHCARHSFATNLIFHGADVNSASSLLGHTSFKYTQQYTHIVASLKEKSVSNLPSVNYKPD
jgi:site-specific recombinase XerD